MVVLYESLQVFDGFGPLSVLDKVTHFLLFDLDNIRSGHSKKEDGTYLRDGDEEVSKELVLGSKVAVRRDSTRVGLGQKSCGAACLAHDVAATNVA